MTSPANTTLRDFTAAMIYAKAVGGAQVSDVDLAIQCLRAAEGFMTGRDVYHQLMAAKPGDASLPPQEPEDDLAG